MSESYLSDKFGELKPVELRQGWRHEGQDFTPWLSQNLKILETAIGLKLELVAVEKQVGPFWADILCKALGEEHFVLVENQLERTDHSHLGQLLTYAAGLEAVTIVWIAGRFTDEHRACLDWLNRTTQEGINFFGLEIELWRIGDSPLAPRLKVVSQPNQWTKQVATSSQAWAESATAKAQLKYWAEFFNFLAARKGPLRPTKVGTPQNWMTLAPFGLNGTAMNVYTRKKPISIGVAFYLTTSLASLRFDSLQSKREAVEQALGAVTWNKSPGVQTAYCSIERTDLDPYDEDSWPEQFEWLAVKAEAIFRTFNPFIAELRNLKA